MVCSARSTPTVAVLFPHPGSGHIVAYSPQARRRSERLFAALQDRLPKEMRLAGIATVEVANAWLKANYIAEHSARFAVAPGQEDSAFIPDAREMWREILCVIEERTVAADNTVAWNGKRVQLPESRLRPHFVRAQFRAHEYPDGACAVFLGPHRLAEYDTEGALCVPTAPKPSVVLGTVMDKTCRALARILDRPSALRQFRCAGRDEETVAQPNKETAQAHPSDRRRMTNSRRAVRGFRPVSKTNPEDATSRATKNTIR